MRNLALAECLQFFRSHLLARLDLHPGCNLFAISGIGHPNDLYIAYLRVSIEEFLNLTRIDVFATSNDHILDATNDVDIAFTVHRRQVASMHPACTVNGLGCGIWVIPVAKHHAVATSTQFSRLTHWDHFPVSWIHYFDLKMWVNDTNRTHALL